MASLPHRAGLRSARKSGSAFCRLFDIIDEAIAPANEITVHGFRRSAYTGSLSMHVPVARSARDRHRQPPGRMPDASFGGQLKSQLAVAFGLGNTTQSAVERRPSDRRFSREPAPVWLLLQSGGETGQNPGRTGDRGR